MQTILFKAIKKCFLIALFILFLMILLGAWLVESRSFYCLSENRCVTVWKTYGNTCYIIPYKYYGLVKPKGNYMITTNTCDVDIIWLGKSDSILMSSNDKYKIINEVGANNKIIEYNTNKEYFDSLFTDKNDEYHRYKKWVNVINVHVKENYATY